MPLHRVFKILSVCFLAAFVLGCGSDDRDFPNFTSFQNNDAPVRLQFQTVPQRAAGSTFGTISVAVIDFNGLVVETDTRPITISLVNPGGATLSGTTTVNAVNGVASFSDLSVNLIGNYSFQATADGLISAESASFTITSGAPNSITLIQGFPVPPGDVITLNTPVSPAIEVQVLDASGNPAPDGTTVSIVTAVDPTGQTVTTGNRVQTVNGIATFPDFTVTEGGGATVFVVAVSGSVVTDTQQTLVAGQLFLYGGINAGTEVQFLRSELFPTPMGAAPVGVLTDYDAIFGLDALPNGNLVAVMQRDTAPNDNAFAIVEMTPAIGFVSETLILGGLPVGPTDITVDPATGQLYAYYAGLGPASGLYTLDRATGVPAQVGQTGLAGTGEGIGWFAFDPNPFIFTGGSADMNGLSIIDVATGAATQITGPDPMLAIDALAVNPYNTDLFGLVNGTGLFIIDPTDGSNVNANPGAGAFNAFSFLNVVP